MEIFQLKLAFTRVYCGVECAVTDVSPAMGGIAWILIVSSQNRMPEVFGAHHNDCQIRKNGAPKPSPSAQHRNEPKNAKVVSDDHVGTSNGVMLRRIVWNYCEKEILARCSARH